MNRYYAIYARQSIDKPDSISIESQIERCRFEVQDQPYKIYSDRGYSGKNTDRPQFQSMLDAVGKGEIGCVVCYKLDRCSRSILDFTQLMALFQEFDVAFISCTEKFDTSTPVGRAMLNICIVFAQLERETIQQRITDAYHSRCKKGYFMGGRVPFGFQLVPYCLDGKKTSCYATVSEEAQILKRIYSDYQQQDASLGDVVLALKEDGILNPRRSDGDWVRPHVGRMIKNPIYAQADERIYRYFEKMNAILDNPIEDFIGYNGCYLYRIGKEQHLVLAPHKGIVPSDVWLRCQKGYQHRRKKNSAKPSWLTGKLKCAICGGSVIEKRSAGKNNRTYRYIRCVCSMEKNRRCNGFKPFSAPTLEAAVYDSIMEHLSTLQDRESVLICEKKDDFSVRKTLMTLASMQDLTIEQLEKSLQELRIQLHCDAPGKRDLTPEVWTQLQSRLLQWEQFSTIRKSQVADLLIEYVELSDRCLKIHWRV